VCQLFFNYYLAFVPPLLVESKTRFLCSLLITIQALCSIANLVIFSTLSQSITESCLIFPLPFDGLQNHYSSPLVLNTLYTLLSFLLDSSKQLNLLFRTRRILDQAESTKPNFRYITGKSDSPLDSPNQTFYFIMSHSRFHVCNHRLSKISPTGLQFQMNCF
jgi:hypothetical protein